MRSFLFVSGLLLWGACAPTPYKDLRQVAHTEHTGLSDRALSYKPSFDKALYECVVEGKTPLGKKYRLSGLLFLKQFEDGTDRVVFQSQMGNTFFDFGWDYEDQFTVHRIIAQMDKPALIATLRKDFELLLFKNLPEQASGFYTDGNYHYLRFELSKGFVYYLFQNQQMRGIENADEKRKVVVMQLNGTASEAPSLASHIHIAHLRAGFTIRLTKLENENSNDATTE